MNEIELSNEVAELNNHLFVHRHFISFKDTFLPCIDYYVFRNGVVKHLHIDSMTETPSGDDLFTIWLNCDDLGEYSPEKINRYNFESIGKKELFDLLEKV